MIFLITPTGARADQFKLCAKWMKRQTYTGKVVWIIVDDAVPTTTDVVGEDFHENWTIYKVYPKPSWNGTNTQGRNIKAGIDVVLNSHSIFDWNNSPKEVEAIFIIEDDDYYRPVYLEKMMERLKGYKVAGEMNTIYYNVRERKHITNQNRQHVSLFQLAFRPELIPSFAQCYFHQFIDYNFFNLIRKQGFFARGEVNIFYDGDLGVGIKGMPGRGGIGAGHKMAGGNNDFDLQYLTKKIGKEDASEYARYYRNNGGVRKPLFVTNRP